MNEFKRIEIVKKAEAFRLRIDDEEVGASLKDNSQLQPIDIIEKDSGYRVTVYDSKIAQLLMSFAVAELPPLNRLRLQCDFEWSAALDWLVHYVQISPTAGSHNFSIEFAFFPGIKDSAKSYVFTDYYWALEQTRRVTKNANLSLKLKSNSDGLTDGFRAEFSCSSVSSPIFTEIEKCVTTLIQLHEKAKTISRVEPPTSKTNVERIIRSIEFPPEYHQSGITILSYFATILRQKHLAENVKVAIEQNGLNVRLVIESPTGKREAIERTLEAYALVVTGKSDLSAFLSDPLETLELKNQLRVAYVQLQAQRDMLELSKSEITNLRLDLTETKRSLALAQDRRSTEAERFMSLLEGLTAQNSDLSRGMQKFTEQALALHNVTLVNALEDLKGILQRGVTENNANDFIEKIQIIKQEAPSLFDQISEFLFRSALSGSVGNAVYDLLRVVIGALPK